MPSFDDKEMIRLVRERFETAEEFEQWLKIHSPTETPFLTAKKPKTDFSNWKTDALKD